MISNCSQRPCGRKIAGWHRKLSQPPLSPGLGPRGSRAEKLRQDWQGVTLVEDSRKDAGESAENTTYPSRPQGSSPPPRPAWGHAAALSKLRGANSPTSERQPWAAKWKPGQRGSSWSWQTENNAPGKNKARGILEEIHPEKPSLPQPIFFSPI